LESVSEETLLFESEWCGGYC